MLEFDPYEIDDLCELLFDPDASDPEVKLRRVRRRGRYIPKVMKNDIRWTYSNMYFNVLGSSDVYLLYSFLRTYAVPDLQHVNILDTKVRLPPTVGPGSFIKHWVLNTCVAPDIVYKIGQSKVKNLKDGSSEISLELTIAGNFVYDKPDI